MHAKMRISARLLLIGLIASGLYFPIRLHTRAQQPGNVNVRQRMTAAQPGVPEVRATVDRNRVPLGDEVVFTVSPASVVTDSRYRVTLFFGDGKQRLMRQAKIPHRYSRSGTYTYSILVERERQSTPTQTPAPAIPNVTLTAEPTSVEVNRPVNFSARLSRSYPNLKYRFVFADGSDSGWQEDSKATHSYRAPNTYLAYVDIGVVSSGSIKQAGGSRRETIRVTAPIRSANANSNSTPRATDTANVNGNANANGNRNSRGNVNANANAAGNLNGNRNGNANNSNANANGNTNASGGGAIASNSTSPSASASPLVEGTNEATDWWMYLIIAAIVLFAAYQAWAYFFPPRPTFVPHVDPGESSVGAEKPLSIDLQMDVDPNLTGGEFKVDTQGDSLVKSKRTEP